MFRTRRLPDNFFNWIHVGIVQAQCFQFKTEGRLSNRCCSLADVSETCFVLFTLLLSVSFKNSEQQRDLASCFLNLQKFFFKLVIELQFLRLCNLKLGIKKGKQSRLLKMAAMVLAVLRNVKWVGSVVSFHSVVIERESQPMVFILSAWRWHN